MPTKTPKKVGMKEDFREGFEYELNVNLRIDADHFARTEKDNTGIFEGLNSMLTLEHGVRLRKWCEEGVDFKAIIPGEIPLDPEVEASLAELGDVAGAEAASKVKSAIKMLNKEQALQKITAGINYYSRAVDIAQQISKASDWQAYIRLHETFQTTDLDKLKLPIVVSAINDRREELIDTIQTELAASDLSEYHIILNSLDDFAKNHPKIKHIINMRKSEVLGMGESESETIIENAVNELS